MDTSSVTSPTTRTEHSVASRYDFRAPTWALSETRIRTAAGDSVIDTSFACPKQRTGNLARTGSGRKDGQERSRWPSPCAPSLADCARRFVQRVRALRSEMPEETKTCPPRSRSDVFPRGPGRSLLKAARPLTSRWWRTDNLRRTSTWLTGQSSSTTHGRSERSSVPPCPLIRWSSIPSCWIDDGPSATLDIELAEAEFPGDPPEKWRRGRVQPSELGAYSAGASANWTYEGLKRSRIFDLKIERVGGCFGCGAGRSRCLWTSPPIFSPSPPTA